MPELPEVETVRNTLKKNVLNREIVAVEIYYPKIIRNISPESFQALLVGQMIKDIERRGKYLIFILTDFILVSHLRMEGKYNLMQAEEVSKHEHIVFRFSDGFSLRYDDVRKFGTMDLYPLMSLEELYKTPALYNVSCDVFEKCFSFDEFYEKLKKTNRAIKTTLLDQSIISGIGNIYVDEVLFMRRIHPLVPASDISKDQAKDIIENTKKVLQKAIDLGGTTIKSFTSSHSISGLFQNELLIHTKTHCPVCNREVTKIKVNGRTSYICEHCQKK